MPEIATETIPTDKQKGPHLNSPAIINDNSDTTGKGTPDDNEEGIVTVHYSFLVGY